LYVRFSLQALETRRSAFLKARLIGDADPKEWDLPPKAKWMRLSTYARWEAKFDQAEEIIDQQCVLSLARLMKSEL
jgi:hypothetical protein